MYRALYAHNSKLPKYLSFQAGDRFTLVDTSVSDQWFLAQNGLGEIGYVPFNYITKMEASTEKQVKFIDGAMEAIHLQATSADGRYTHEQRLIMKKLVKHRSDVIKNAAESSTSKSPNRRRPAPAPPVQRNQKRDTPSVEKTASLSVVGTGVTGNSSSQVQSKKEQTRVHKKKSSNSSVDEKSASAKDRSSHSESSDTDRKDIPCVDKVSLSSSVGQSASLVSSVSSNTSNMTTTGSVTDDGKSEDFCVHDEKKLNDSDICSGGREVEACHDPVKAGDSRFINNNGSQPFEKESQHESCSLNENNFSAHANDVDDTLPPPIDMSDFQESYESTSSSALGACELPLEDLPPPPPEVYDDIDCEQFAADDTLPPAPAFLLPMKENPESKSLSSTDDLDFIKKTDLEECKCDDFEPKFDPEEPFFARNALELPPDRRVKVTKKERQCDRKLEYSILTSLLEQDDPDEQQDAATKHRELFELAQAHCVNVTHADCEEMIGEFRKVTNLSHEESHWALMASMNLLVDKVPHIKPSLEVVGMKFSMARECHSTGRNFYCEDTLALDRLVGELSTVTYDSQQRGHYLEDDLDSIIDIITGLSETLTNAKHCVSVSAIQKDNYGMVELIAKYYQMETRWVIHSCLLQLIEIICRLNTQAIMEFLYSELPQEMVAEIQQHSNDDVRFLQVSKTLGVIFMRGKPSPHKLNSEMDIHFFIWLFGMIENLAEMNRHDDVELMLAVVCSYHLQHKESSQNPVTDALKMAQSHAFLESALAFLSKHDDPTRLLNVGFLPRVNSIILLLTHLYDHPDTSDLLYTNDVEALIGIFEEFLRNLSKDDSMRSEVIRLLENFLRNYPDTVSFKMALSSRLGPLLLTVKDERGSAGKVAARILEDNIVVFDDC